MDVHYFLCIFQEQQQLKALDEEFHRKLAIEMKKVILIVFFCN